MLIVLDASPRVRIQSSRRPFLLLVFLTASAVLSSAPRAAEPAPGRQVLLQDGFEKGLEGWQTEGAAEFSASAEKPHGGERCAKITVGGANQPAYQKLCRYVDEQGNAGDRYRATVWGRTSGVTTNPGAYVVFEFYDGDKRLDVAHGGMATDATAREWQQLTVDGVAPKGGRRVRLCLLLHAAGSAWFDDLEVTAMKRNAKPEKPAAPCVVRVDTAKVLNPRFGGVGFHMFDHLHKKSDREMNEVFAKRWRELNPSFARLTHSWSWDWPAVIANMKRLRDETKTEIYLTTWDPKDAKTPEERAAYATKVVDMLERLVKQEDLTNLRTYCLTNELSLNGWGKLQNDLPKFKAYHQAFYEELKARKLEVGLLATDASPIQLWHTIEWAAKNMDEITAVYGGHHYINDIHPKDDHFYGWFLERMQWGADLAKSKGKPFMLGEFGAKQDGRTIKGAHMDACVFWDTPDEPYVSLQIAEAALAALNGGVYGLGYWTYADFPDDPKGKYQNKWGLFKWSGTDHSTRTLYYSYGLLTRFFRGPATVVSSTPGDEFIRAGAVQHHDGKTWSVALLNRYHAEAPVTIEWSAPPDGRPFRKYAWAVNAIPSHPFGDLQPPESTLPLKDGRLADTLAPLSLTVYTTAYDDDPPAAVKDVKTAKTEAGANRVTWQANAEPDFCYYRVYRGEKADFTPNVATQIGSTVATDFEDAKPGAGEAHYKVIAVDQSGNASKP